MESRTEQGSRLSRARVRKRLGARGGWKYGITNITNMVVLQICCLQGRDAGDAASGEPQSGPRGNNTCKRRRCCFWGLRDRWQERAVPFVPFVTRSPGSLRKEGYKCSGHSRAAEFSEARHQQPGICSVPQEGRRCFGPDSDAAPDGGNRRAIWEKAEPEDEGAEPEDEGKPRQVCPRLLGLAAEACCHSLETPGSCP